MKKLHPYLKPSLLSIPTYMGIFTLGLIILYFSYQLQQLPTRINQEASLQTLDKPWGKIRLSKSTVANSGDSIVMTAQAKPKVGHVEYVRYYLLNPTLGLHNDWEGPNWCSCGRVCGLSDACSMKTWDLGESGDAARNFSITWGSGATSGISTQVSRKLNPTNIPPGIYDLYIQVKDSAGNINESADFATIMVTGGPNVLGVQSTPEIALTSCGKEESPGMYSFTFEDTNPGPSPISHYYQLDQGIWIPSDGLAFSLAIPGGEHIFGVQAIDGAGLVASARCHFKAE